MSGAATHTHGRPARTGAPPSSAIGMVADERTRALLTQTATDRGIPCAFELGSIEEAIERLDTHHMAGCVVIEISDASAAVDDVAILASHFPSSCTLVLLGDFSEAERAELRAAGASLCIGKSTLPEQLNDIFGVPIRQSPAPSVNSQAAAVGARPSRQTPTADHRSYEPASFSASAPAKDDGHLAQPSPALRTIATELQASTPSDVPERHARTAPLITTEASAHIAGGNTSDQPPPNRQQLRRLDEPPLSYREPPPPQVRKTGRIIVVLGCRGGVGATTIAVSLAWMLSEEFGQSTALLDLDAYFGSVALALNLDPGEGLAQALERPNRLDPVFVDRAVRKIGQHMFVLSGEHALDKPLHVDPTAAASVVKALSYQHQRVVVDLPRHDPHTISRVLAMADEVLLVTDLSLPGARDAVRLLGLVRQATTYAHVRVIGSGSRQNSKSTALTPSEFRKAAGLNFEIAIAHDAEAANEAARTGKPIAKVAPRGPASKTLRNLATTLEPSDQRERKRRLLFWKN